MVRSPCCDKLGLKKGPWTAEEDKKLLAYIEKHGHGNWRSLPPKAGLKRCGKSCRLRWTNYLRPDFKRGDFTLQEDQTIIQLHALLGNRWSAIAAHLQKRTDNEIKNYWNIHLKKRLDKMGIDPVTHKPKADAFGSGNNGSAKNVAKLNHMAQWESARLEAETRLARESRLLSTTTINPLQSHLTVSTPQYLDVLKAWEVMASTTFMTPTRGFLESPTSTLNFVDNILPLNNDIIACKAGVGKELNTTDQIIPEGVLLMDGNNDINHDPSIVPILNDHSENKNIIAWFDNASDVNDTSININRVTNGGNHVSSSCNDGHHHDILSSTIPGANGDININHGNLEDDWNNLLGLIDVSSSDVASSHIF